MAETNDNQPATKGDLKELATKGDLSELARATKADLAAVRSELKGDLKELATKADLAVVKADLAVVKGDLKELAQTTKADFAVVKGDLKNLDQKVNTLGIELAKTQLRVDRVETNIMTAMREFKSELLSAFEESVMKGRKYDQKTLTHGDMLNGHEAKLLSHENRITLLETKK